MIKNDSLKFISKNKQIIYSLTLLVIIPSAILINSFLFIGSFKDTIDQSLRLKATAMAEIINVALLNNTDNDQALQATVTQIAKFNDDVKALDILKFDTSKNKFTITASLNQSLIGKANKSTNNYLAWDMSRAIATMSSEPNSSGKLERVWVIATPLKDAQGQNWGLLSLSTSLKLMDDFMAPVLTRSLIILICTILVIILLLFANGRLFEYAMLYNKIKELDQMKDEFVSMASHELRTPITVIQGYATVLLEDKSGQVQMNDLVRNNLILMKDSSNRLKVLIEDVLNVSRIEQGRLSFDNHDLDPVVIIEETVKELANSAQEKKLALNFKPLSKKISLISVDHDRFKQVLINIIGNAIKYTPSGSVTISATINAKEKVFEIKVKDTGIGMSAKERTRLFEKFYRVQNDKTANVAGTGLGLWITKQIVEAMKGEIMVDSIEDVGTQISLKFPLVKTKANNPAKNSTAVNTEPQVPASSSPKQIKTS